MKKRDEIIYNGEKYYRFKGNWADRNYCIVPEILQRKLNSAWAEQEDISKMTYEELLEAATKYKESSSAGLAEKYLCKALEIADKMNDQAGVRQILPRLTSIYRSQKQPVEAIALYKKYYNVLGVSIDSAALYTSLAAACCDINDYEKARRLANRAFAISGGKGSGELSAVYGRIKKESGSY